MIEDGRVRRFDLCSESFNLQRADARDVTCAMFDQLLAVFRSTA